MPLGSIEFMPLGNMKFMPLGSMKWFGSKIVGYWKNDPPGPRKVPFRLRFLNNQSVHYAQQITVILIEKSSLKGDHVVISSELIVKLILSWSRRAKFMLCFSAGLRRLV